MLVDGGISTKVVKCPVPPTILGAEFDYHPKDAPVVWVNFRLSNYNLIKKV